MAQIGDDVGLLVLILLCFGIMAEIDDGAGLLVLILLCFGCVGFFHYYYLFYTFFILLCMSSFIENGKNDMKLAIHFMLQFITWKEGRKCFI